MKYFNDIIKDIRKEDIVEYYNNQNHTLNESAIHFNLSWGMFIRVLKYYNIRKDKDKHAEMIKKVKEERYGDPNYNNRDAAKTTCLRKYGVDNPFKDKEKIKTSYIEKLGVDHPMHREDIVEKCISKKDYAESTAKGAATYYKKTGFTNPSKNPECIKKNLQTRIAHGVFNSPSTSNIERRCEKILIRKFGDVKLHYRDNRYSRATGYLFECDFYIPKEDLFIELNGHPSHYKHPYNSADDADVRLRESLSHSNKKWDKLVLETWALRDVEKMECAKSHSLNYIVIYPYTSLSENLKFNDKKYEDLIKYIFNKIVIKRK